MHTLWGKVTLLERTPHSHVELVVTTAAEENADGSTLEKVDHSSLGNNPLL